jgi:hypothetical protein
MSVVQVQGVPWFDAVTVLACAVCGLVRWWVVSRSVRRQVELVRQVLLAVAAARWMATPDSAGAACSSSSALVRGVETGVVAGLSLAELGQLCSQLAGARVGEGLVVGERG